jgi:hypothetical protein
MRNALAVFLTLTPFLTLAAADTARPSPQFSLMRVGAPAQPPLDLASLKGKVVALAFIDTNCVHCQELTRTVLIPVAREYGLRGVEVLECAFNDLASQQLPAFIQQFPPSFPVGWSTRAAVMAYLRISLMDPHPLYVPHLVFLDRRGVIRAEYPGESEFFKDAAKNVRAELEKLLTPVGPARGKASRTKK